MSIFGCLVDCARFDPLSECTSLGQDGRDRQRSRSPNHKDEEHCSDGRDGSFADGERLPADTLYTRLRKQAPPVSLDARDVPVTGPQGLRQIEAKWSKSLSETHIPPEALARFRCELSQGKTNNPDGFVFRPLRDVLHHERVSVRGKIARTPRRAIEPTVESCLDLVRYNSGNRYDRESETSSSQREKSLGPGFCPRLSTRNPSSLRHDRYPEGENDGGYAPVDRSSLPTLRSVQGARSRTRMGKRKPRISPKGSSRAQSTRGETTAGLNDLSESSGGSTNLDSDRGSDGDAGEADAEGEQSAMDKTRRQASRGSSTGEETPGRTRRAMPVGDNALFSTPSRPPKAGRRVAVRSSSLGTAHSDPHRRNREKAFRSVPGGRDVRPSSTPGRTRPQGSRIMSRRVVAKWDDKEEGAKNPLQTPERPRRLVSTSVGRLRMSDDGSTVKVTSDKGGVDHELALSDLLEVHGTPSRKRVVLRGKDLELQIAFDGENVAFDQFRDTLIVPNNAPGTGTGTEPGATGNDDPQRSCEDGDCGLTEYPSSGSQSGAGSERAEVESDDVSSVGTQLTPRSSIANSSSPSRASSVSDVGSHSSGHRGNGHSHGSERKANAGDANGRSERLLRSPASTTRRYRVKYGSSSPSALTPRRKGPEGEPLRGDANGDAVSDKSSESVTRKIPVANQRARGGRKVDSMRASGNVCGMGSEPSGGLNAEEGLERGNMQRLTAKLSLRNAGRLRESDNDCSGGSQNAGVVVE